jgi:S-DNA-T family DNA segregation ATPase FtsK/SpoIIIE
MARPRRQAKGAARRSATVRLNLEIVGVAAIGLAVLLGVALSAPLHSGVLGALAARALTAAFGSVAWLAPLVIALIGAIVFLEIDVPRIVATLGGAAVLSFFILDAAYGSAGGAAGGWLQWGLRALLGETGTSIVLVLSFLAVALWAGKFSLKHLIGRVLALGARAFALLRGAFGSIQTSSRPAVASAAAPAALVKPVRSPLPAAAPVYDVAAGAAADEKDEDGEGEANGEDFDDDLDGYEDDDEFDDEDAGEEGSRPPAALTGVLPPAGAPALLAGEYEPPLSTRARVYRLPDLAVFDPPQAQLADDSSRAGVLEDTLASFGVGAKVVHIERGPSITRYELKPERGVKIARIASLADDLALALAATSVRIEAPIPGKSAVGIEVPNATISVVAIAEILAALPQRGTIPPLNVALGKDITGRPVFGDLGRMPHLLVAGATGSGKSVCLNAIIASLLASATPDQVQLLMIDPKRVELTVYNGIPHLIKEVITDARMAAGALQEMTREMDSRYERFAKAGVRKIEEYNAKYPEERLPYVAIVIDELADLMLIAPAKVELTICRLAQLARATGIHLIVATQRPSVDVITGIIKANIPSRIAFAVSSQVDSRTILDMAGAERLLGRGDMLYLPIDAPKPIRAQGALITGSEVNRLVAFWAAQSRPENLVDVEVTPIDDDEEAQRRVDPLAYEAAKFIIETSYASTAQLQSRFSIGHPRAVRVMKQLEEIGVVGPHEGTKPRRINLGLADLEQIVGRFGKPAQLELAVE